jgi:alpha-galactosidase
VSRSRTLRLSLLTLCACGGTLAFAGSATTFHQWAEKPPLGWNSWDCFATTITEAQAKAQADSMAEHLAPWGWQYLVVDIQWYEPEAKSFAYRKGAKLTMDDLGRLWPATNRFPSSVNGVGFKALSEYVHGKGLKFGVHLLRGIPRQAVALNTSVKGTPYHATDIADTNSTCAWNTDMFGVDMSRPGAQDYYNSVFDLFADWGVDFVKVDDIARPYHKPEIEAIRQAIDHTGRPMVLSLSPGETSLAEGEHVSAHANMWRVSDDFWDKWPLLLEQFERLRKWAPYCGPGHFPDADMLPLGVTGMGRHTHFTPDEQYTLMTLWSIARSPLIFGGDMTRMDSLTLTLLTNAEVLAVDQDSRANHQLYRREGLVAWVADAPASPDKYVALFNTRDASPDQSGLRVPVALPNKRRIRDLWQQKDLGEFETEFAPEIHWHGAGLYRVSGEVAPPKAMPGLNEAPAGESSTK